VFDNVIERVPQLGPRAAYARQIIRDKLIAHKTYIAEHGIGLHVLALGRTPHTPAEP
jgi:phosphoketolase